MRKEHELALYNSKALKSILGGVDQKMVKLINKGTTTKEAWEILETTNEGFQQVKDDPDPHLKGDDVAPNAISEDIETERGVVKIFETLVEENVTIYVGNTMKTIVVVPIVVQHATYKVHDFNNPTEEIVHNGTMMQGDVTPSTDDIVELDTVGTSVNTIYSNKKKEMDASIDVGILNVITSITHEIIEYIEHVKVIKKKLKEKVSTF
ncbi:hypothetical protein LIER_19475 [Lithospermum erythrorhizon]|uniref:Uncharacterized protein n=1 Tax=Lithospermum erythrorhizon TaxID=34254 RepID=A0AAV3QM80_LITER